METTILDSKKIIETIQLLSIRIGERFPNSGLLNVSKNLLKIAKDTDKIILWIEKPNYFYRVGVGTFITAAIAGLVYSILTLKIESKIFTLSTCLALSEAAL